LKREAGEDIETQRWEKLKIKTKNDSSIYSQAFTFYEPSTKVIYIFGGWHNLRTMRTMRIFDT
jgi:hypothetical protein